MLALWPSRSPGQEYWYRGQSSSAAVPHMINGFVNSSVDFLVVDIPYLRCAAIEKRFEPSGERRAIFRRWNLLRRNRGNTDFLIGPNWPVQELF
ncbi:MAG TPA: hypothetical protein VH640_30265 [Bryobacteraceae bacterium]